MPELETPPNPAPLDQDPEDPGQQPLKMRAGRHGELDHTELVHLLDSLDDDRSRSRFRESVYISFIVWLAIGWFIFYGPRVLFHQGRLIDPADVLKQRDKQLTYLEMPKNLEIQKPKDAKAISDHNTRQQTAHPTLDKKTLEQLQAMRRAGNPGPVAPRPTPQPKPEAAQPAAPQPQPQPQPTAQPAPAKPAPSRPIPAAPTPNLPSAPAPAPTRPNFSTPATAGDAVREAANAAARNHSGGGGEGGLNAPNRHAGLQSGVEVLSDTQGVDFGPYLRKLKRVITASWYPLIPEECYPPLNKEGQTLIRFTIQPNGTVSAMHLDGSTHDVAIDKAAWGGITGVGQMPPLPAEFHGENLQLRVTFVITHDRSAAE